MCALSRPQVTMGLGLWDGADSSGIKVLCHNQWGGRGGCLQGLGLRQSDGFLILNVFVFPLIYVGQLDIFFF